MKSEQIQQIISEKNEQRERQIVRSAEDIIENIVREQQAIAASAARIQAFREELAKLQVEELDPTAILGSV